MPFPAFYLLAAALGAREGIANRRNKQNVLDLEAERQTEINAIDLGIDSIGGTNRFDARQIEVLKTQFQTAQGMMRSQDSSMQKLGANMMADIDTAVRANIQQNETEARADAQKIFDQVVLDAGAGKASNERRFDQELVMNRQLNNDLKPFLDATVSFNKVMNLLDNNDQLASLAGLTAFVQGIDNSVVREGELLKYQGANGAIVQIVNLVNKTAGRDFDPTTKQSIRNAAAALVNSEKQRAVAITNSYQDRAISFALSPERVLSGVDENLFTPIPIDRDALARLQADADAAQAAKANFIPIEEAATGLASQISNATFGQLGEGAAILADKALQTWQAAGRALSGSSLHIDPATGMIWERDAQGNFTQIQGTIDEQRQAEILRIQNREGAQLTPSAQAKLDELLRQQNARSDATQIRPSGL
jgi:hypothetical protein